MSGSSRDAWEKVGSKQEIWGGGSCGIGLVGENFGSLQLSGVTYLLRELQLPVQFLQRSCLFCFDAKILASW